MPADGSKTPAYSDLRQREAGKDANILNDIFSGSF